MHESQERWLLPQITRLAKSDPPKFAELAETLQLHAPAVYEALALMAVDRGDLSADDCAGHLCTDRAVVDSRLEDFRRDTLEVDSHFVEKDAAGVARLAGTQVAVWEVVRAFRKLGSVGDLKAKYTSLTETELRAALAYAGRHPDEVGEAIQAYEEVSSKARTTFPT